ncbi:hypothetical protein A2U01_0067742, partial [Trifolium medium]|nr:hypothetical protein [Trifolium medium]
MSWRRRFTNRCTKHLTAVSQTQPPLLALFNVVNLPPSHPLALFSLAPSL